jgi:ketosteroid isomerase-like protein
MRRYRAAAARGDFEAAFGMFADDITFRVPGRSSHAGEHAGRAAAMAYIDAARGLAHDGDVEVEVVDALTSEDRFALIVREVFHRPEGDVVIRRANVYRVRGDEIAEVWIFEGDQYEVDALLP